MLDLVQNEDEVHTKSRYWLLQNTNIIFSFVIKFSNIYFFSATINSIFLNLEKN